MSTSPAHSAISRFPPTPEQQDILNNPPTSTIIVEAYAGCAKTSTLEMYARKWPEYRGLYLAFNSSIAAEANGRFPSHIENKTGHAYAFRQMGVSQHKDRLVKKLWPTHLDKCADLLRPVPGMNDIQVRRAILRSLENYLISDDRNVQLKHLQGFQRPIAQIALPMVDAVIQRIMDYPNTDMAFTHDVYFKDFALNGRFQSNIHYIMLDEGQDSNDVMIGCAARANLPLLVVGDHYQSIYAFRGSTNAMAVFEGKRFPLSTSFRFGPAIAILANHLLSFSTQKPTNRLYGNMAKNTQVLEYRGTIGKRATILARTNMRLFEGLPKLIEKQVKFHVIGNGLDEMLNQVEAGYELSIGLRPKRADPLISRFKSWSDLKDAAEFEDDADLTRLVKIIELYGDGIPELITSARELHVPREKDAIICLSTAHKAKGREWPVVVILEDFPLTCVLVAKLQKKRLDPVEYDQEINLLYVATTRAVETLYISPALYEDVAGGSGLPRSY